MTKLRQWAVSGESSRTQYFDEKVLTRCGFGEVVDVGFERWFELLPQISYIDRLVHGRDWESMRIAQDKANLRCGLELAATGCETDQRTKGELEVSRGVHDHVLMFTSFLDAKRAKAFQFGSEAQGLSVVPEIRLELVWIRVRPSSPAPFYQACTYCTGSRSFKPTIASSKLLPTMASLIFARNFEADVSLGQSLGKCHPFSLPTIIILPGRLYFLPPYPALILSSTNMLNLLPPEVLLMVVEEYLRISQGKSAKKRAKALLRISQINRQTRAITLGRPALWSTIHLHLPPNVSTLFFQRAAGHKIKLYLDTKKPNAASASELEHWIAFMRSNMGAVEHFELLVRSTVAFKKLIGAFETPAPNLRSLSVKFVQQEFPSSMAPFSGEAPNLHTAIILSRLPWKLEPFPSVTTLTLHISRENLQKNVSQLQYMHNAEAITLTGANWQDRCDDLDVPPPSLPGSIVLPACRQFEIKQVTASTAQYILDSVRLPALEKLIINETLYTRNLHTETPTEIVRASVAHVLAAGPKTCIPPTSLFIGIHPRRVVIRTNGTPSIDYTSSWIGTGMDQLLDAPDNECVLPTLIDMCTCLSRTLGVQPTDLTIHYNIWPKKFKIDKQNNKHPIEPTALSSIDSALFFREVFDAYPHVVNLELSGRLGAGAAVLRGDQALLPICSRIKIKTDLGNFNDNSENSTLTHEERQQERQQLRTNVALIGATRGCELVVQYQPGFL
ncbi:hypothetical protein SISNIDRAFT_468495 [Sistotremastrum niveocremeum HHB9708]|uniref:F-box domain-containing protein n=1 Tax=Sistotremastrum niveocremeum HHB9708 TaxID=1314777 RepID=A0A164RBI2_9AGAM|nr:hypothetical protein SISNIDRAFT_468495 [Sistotremastrum niveocremeum HHB9708]